MRIVVFASIVGYSMRPCFRKNSIDQGIYVHGVAVYTVTPHIQYTAQDRYIAHGHICTTGTHVHLHKSAQTASIAYTSIYKCMSIFQHDTNISHQTLSTFCVSWTPLKSQIWIWSQQNSALLHLGPFLLCLSVTWFARFLWTEAVKISLWFHSVDSASLELERAKKNREGELLREGTLNCYVNCSVRKINSPSPPLPPILSPPLLSLFML